MDNDKLSKIPVSELTPENLNSLKRRGNVSLPESSNKKTNKLPLIIAGIVLLIGVGVALFFIFHKPTETPVPEEKAYEEPEPKWEPSEESEDPSGEYVDHQQSIIDNPTTTSTEKLDAEIAIVNHYVVLERYGDAEEKLNTIQREGRSNRELFRIYSAYCNLYMESGDEASLEKYQALLDEVLDADWGEASEGDESAEEE